MLSFENTEIAFSGKSNKDLNRAYLLFKLVSNNFFVRTGKVMTNMAIKMHLPVKGLIKATIFKHFCGGETISECEKTIQQLAKYNIGTILDYSVEGAESEEDFDKTTEEIIATIRKAKGNKNIPFSVFKITGIASNKLLEKANNGMVLSLQEKKDFERVTQRVNTICKAAFECAVPVLVDAEESWMQKTIDSIATDMMALYNKEKAIVYNTIQMYRHDRLSFLKHALAESQTNNYFLGIKLVRGAYMEKERKKAVEQCSISPIQPDKSATDSDYDHGLEYCIENISKIALCAGTHNEKSSLYLTKLMDDFRIKKDHPHVYFSQLLGMSDHISYNLAATGYNVAKYVPYGPVKEVLPYLIRRAEENTSVAGQTGRELSLIIKEKARRKAINAKPAILPVSVF